MRPSQGIFLLLAAPGALLAAHADAPVEWEKDIGLPLVEPSSGSAWAVRPFLGLQVLDRDTGKPVPGSRVTVHAYRQDEYPEQEGTTPDREESATADDDGQVVVPLPRLAGAGISLHLVVQASGHWDYHGDIPAGPFREAARLERRPPGPSVWTFEAKDFLGHPLKGLEFEMTKWDGPGPERLHGVTGTDGILRMNGLDPAAAWGYRILDERKMECRTRGFFNGTPMQFPRADDSWEQPSPPGQVRLWKWTGGLQEGEGVLLDHAGKPVSGFPVYFWGDLDRRDPVKTDPEGRFSAPGFAGSSFHAGSLDFVLPPAGFRRVVRLPPPGTEDRKPDTVPVRVRIHAPGPPLEKAKIWVVSDVDGYTDGGESQYYADWDLQVPPGPCTVVVGDGMGPFLQTRVRAVATTGMSSVDVTLIAKPVLPVRLQGLPEGGSVELWTGAGVEGSEQVLPLVQAGGVPIPPTGDAVFLLDGGDGRRRMIPVPEGRPRGGGSPLVLPWFPSSIVRARFLGSDGKPAKVRCALQEDVPNSREYFPKSAAPVAQSDLAISTGDFGRRYLVVLPEDPTLLGEAVPVDLPDDGGGDIDLGTLDLRSVESRPRVTVQGPEGDLSLAFFLRDHATLVRSGLEDCIFPSDSAGEGLVLGFQDTRPGDSVLLEGFDLTEARFRDGQQENITTAWTPSRQVRLSGPGPWTVPWPKGSIRLAPVDEKGAPIAAWMALVDSNAVALAQPALDIVGLKAGPHRILVAAHGRIPRDIRLVLKEGERRDSRPVLRTER